MKTVPLNGGTVPLCNSKNPVLGVFLHHCGTIATVHQPKGRRSKTRYLICGQCGTDQCGGAEYQADIKAKTYPTIEALQAATSAAYTANEPAEKVEPTTKPVLAENEPDQKPLETAPHAVSTVKPTLEIVEPITEPVLTEKQPAQQTVKKPLQAAPSAVHTANSIPPKAEPAPNNQMPDPAKPMRIGFAAVLGGLIGGLFAMVA